MATLSLAFLGPFTVTYDGHVVAEFRTRSIQALLAYLAVEEPRPHQRDALAELLWPGYPSGSARKNLRQTLYELGRLIPEVATGDGSPAPFTLGTRETLQRNPDCRFELDTAAFTGLVHDGGADALKNAVALYRGDFLGDFTLPDSGAFETWAAAWRGRFWREALEALDRLASNALEHQDYAQAESYARRQLELDDLREAAVAQLMRALAGEGERSAALVAYDEARQRLQAELGVEPGDALSALWEQIRSGESGAAAGQSSSVAAPSAEPETTKPAHNLPASATPFIGRDVELEQIQNLLAEDNKTRLLTLLGPGGSGKTRLALQTAAILAERTTPFAGGVWFVPLAPVRRLEEGIHAIAGVLNFTFLGKEPLAQQLTDSLRRRHLLLLLDNFEQLVGEKSAAFLSGLLHSAPGVKILVTSRSRLQLAGEVVFPVPGLTVPPETESPEIDRLQAYEGVKLFEARARQVRPDFVLSTDNGPAVASICRLVVGMPLAIELAASWADQLEPEEIAAEIARNLDFLETELYDVPPRQRSLRAVFATSWQMLSPEEQGAISGLSYFAGPVSREAAREVAEAGLRQLGALLHKSWLTRDEHGRYALHPLLCQFVSRQLWADPDAGREVAEAHHRYYLALAERLAREMRGPGQVEALEVLSRDLANFHATWNDLVDQGKLEPVVTQLLPALFRHAEVMAYGGELMRLVEETLAHVPVEDASRSHLRAILLTVRGAFDQNNSPLRFEVTGVILPTFKRYAEEAWSLVDAEQRSALGMWGTLLAYVYGCLVDRDSGIAAVGRMVEVMRRERRSWEQAQALYYLSWLSSWNLSTKKELETPMDFAHQALTLFQSSGDRWESSYTLGLLGNTARWRRRPADAIHYWKAAQEELAALGDVAGSATIDWLLGDEYLTLGETEVAFRHYRDMKRKIEAALLRRFTAYALSKLSIEASRYRPLEEARATRQQALDLARELDDPFGEAWSVWEMGELYRLEGDPAKALRWYEQAHSLFAHIDDPNFLAFYHRGLGDLALAAGNHSEALQHFTESLSVAEAADHTWMRFFALNSLARTHHGLGEEKAAWGAWRLALKAAADNVAPGLISAALATGAALYATYGDPVRALELATCVVESPVTWHEMRGQAAGTLHRILPRLDEQTAEAAQERGRQLQLETVLDEELSR